MKNTIIFIIVVVVILIGGFIWMSYTTSQPTKPATLITNDTSSEITNELNVLDRQNNSDDLSKINSDFGAEINQAVK